MKDRDIHYFVDESGDQTIFKRKGKVIIGEEGVSRFFILGSVEIEDIGMLATDMDTLRNDILHDPYFKNVPSVMRKNNKTALGFHAKDDIPEVREKVFKLIYKHKLKFWAVIKDKLSVLEKIRELEKTGDSSKYQPNLLYDEMVTALFTGPHLLNEKNKITFSSRGSKNRTDALRKAINHALVSSKGKLKEWETQRKKQKSFLEKLGDSEINQNEDLRRIRDFVDDPGLDYFINRKSINPHVEIHAIPFHHHAGLQVVDYCLWALNRVMTRKEERYLEYIWDKVDVVKDLDDTRKSEYGKFYGNKARDKESKRLTVEELTKRKRGI